ncbi:MULTISPECIES: hypothetical protein [unclassified Streptomyces]|uniref:hypothetical protein n=1 Tax=unclassified Streptomyces TaxID=2593676 RepID=UPI00278BF328|nr:MULTISPECIES: hypothetical protein [unclassified Streptomyces]
MTVGPSDEWRERVEARSAYVMRHLGGWLLGAFVVLVGGVFALVGASALDGGVTVTAQPGTFRVQSCEFAHDINNCKGTFEENLGGRTSTGASLEHIGRTRPGDRLPAFKVPDGYTSYPSGELAPSDLARGLVLTGAGVVAVACGLFAVFTGYSPRASYTSGRPDASYGRIGLVGAWRGLGRGRWAPVRLILCGLAGLGVLAAAGAGVVSLLYR